jgi:hypothetical protein
LGGIIYKIKKRKEIEVIISENTINPVPCYMHGPYCSYALLNILKPGKFVYPPLTFEFEPLYIGEGKENTTYSRPKQSKKGRSEPTNEREERILEIGVENILIRMIGYYKDKDHSKLVEAKILNIMPRDMLTNGRYPYLKSDQKKLYDDECYVSEYERETYDTLEKINKIKTKREDEFDCYYYSLNDLYSNIFNKQYNSKTLNPKLKYEIIKNPYGFNSIEIKEHSNREIGELLGIDLKIIKLFIDEANLKTQKESIYEKYKKMEKK